MKVIFKKNKMLIISLIIITIWVIVSCVMYQLDFQRLRETSIRNLEYCKNNLANDLCKKISVVTMPDTISIFFQLIINYSLSTFAYFLFPIFIILPVTNAIYNEIKTGYFKNILTRMSYKNYISKIYLTSLKSLIILPFFLLILFIGSYILSGGNLTIPTEESCFIAEKYLNNIVQFGLIYIVNIFLLNWFIINISYILTIKSHHLISSVVGSYLCYWIIWIVFESFIGLPIQKNFGVELLTNSLSFANFWIYDNVISLPFMVCYAIILVLLTGIVSYFVSKNKERIIYNAENTN